MNVEAILARLVAFHVLRLNAVAGAIRQDGIDTIICNPGDISRAHRSNECIETGELAARQQMIEHLAA
jgi:acetylornithine deacetylase/succinyl-diaminopimelate desuccinylase-like protein